MKKTIFSTLTSIITNSYFWLFFIFLALLDTSNYDLELFIGNASIASILWLIFAMTTNRIAFSNLLVLIIIQSLEYVSNLKVELLNSNITLSDLIFFSHLRQYAGEDLIFSYFNFTYLIYEIFCILLLVHVFNYSNKFINAGKIILSFKRIGMYLSAILIWFSVTNSLGSSNCFFKQWISNIKSKKIEACTSEYQTKNLERKLCESLGPLLNIAEGYSQPNLEGIETLENSSYIKELVKNQNYDQNNDDILPNIILVLNESTFDPQNLKYDFADSIEIPFFKSDTKLKGDLKVHTFGGGSTISEYPSLTGIVNKVFKGPNLYPFINMAFITRPSIFKELKALGYYTLVIYPTTKNLVNAKNALMSLDADKVVDIFDYGLNPSDWRDVPEKFLGSLIDKELESAPKDKPVFIYVSTMRNHGPHKKSLKDTIGCNESLNHVTCSKLNDYVERLRKTSDEWTEYNNNLLGRDYKTIIINFGDHMPSFEGKTYNLEFKYDNKFEIYKTFFNVRSNIDIKTYNYKELDISYLPGLILDLIKQNKNEFYRASSIVREKCDGKLFDCQEKNLIESYKALMIEQLELN